MFLVAKLHPNLDETEQEDYQGNWLSKTSKHEIIKRFYERSQEIPLCIDHRNTGKTGYVEGKDRVGKVCDLFLNKEAELMVKCELFNQHEHGFKEVNQGIFRDKKRWGVSVGLANVADAVSGKKSRNLVHVALTSDPAFAAQGTYLSHWALEESNIDRLVAREYGNGYLPPQLRAKLEVDRNRQMEQPEQQEITMEFDASEQKPLTTTQKKDELIRMRKHYKEAGCDFLDMDRAFRDRYLTLDQEYNREVEDQNSFLVQLCAERNVPSSSKDLLFKILTSTEPDAAQVQQTMIDFVGANAEHAKIANERNQQLTQEKELLQQENIKMKQQLEQEAVNANNKRARTTVSPFNFNTVTTTTSVKKETTPQQPQQKSYSVATASTPAPTSYTYREDLKVHSTMPFDNPKLNALIKQDMKTSPYEKKNEYITPSAVKHNSWHQLHLLSK